MLARALGKEVASATGLIYFLGIVCLAVLECLGACEELFHVEASLQEYGGARLWGGGLPERQQARQVVRVRRVLALQPTMDLGCPSPR